MAKTRAEIQKAYRERKKLNDPNFLANERRRQTRYRVRAADLSRPAWFRRRTANKIHCQKYSEKKRKEKQAIKERENHLADDVPSTSSANTETRRKTRNSSSSTPLIVQFPFSKRKTSQLENKRPKALDKAYKSLKKMQNKYDDLTRRLGRVRKRHERIVKRMKLDISTTSASSASSADESVVEMTPRSKTNAEIKQAGIDKQILPKSITKKLTFANVLAAQFKQAYGATKRQDTHRKLRLTVAGKIVKKYRCINILHRDTGIRRSTLSRRLERRHPRNAQLRSSLQEKVVSFYERDDVSRVMPGKRDGVDEKQNRILNDYMSNTYQKFRCDNPEVMVSFSSFCKLRPAHVKLTSLLSRNTCLCTIHQNMAMKMKCLLSLGVDVSLNPETTSKKVTSNEMTQLLTQITSDDEIEYDEWKKVEINGKKKMRIVRVKKSKAEFLKLMSNEYKSFQAHVERVRQQYNALSQLKKNLPTGHAVVQMDFSENFTCQHADEIQSAYWNSTSVTLHPVVAYYKDEEGNLKHKSYVFLSSVKEHNAKTVTAILGKLMPTMKQDIPLLSYVHYWTDSPSSQYRNRLIFSLVCKHEELFGVGACWDFFEVGHGKSVCDGVGGVAKRQAADAVKQGKAVIQDSDDFFAWATSSQKGITYISYSQEDYDEAATLLSTMDCQPLNGTQKLHAVIPLDKTQLLVRSASCYCQGCIDGTKRCDGWVKRSLKPKQPQDDGYGSAAAPAKNSTPLQPGKFVGAIYEGTWYVGKVLEVDEKDNDTKITFMTAVHSKVRLRPYFKWPHPADEVWVALKDVLTEVEPPTPIGKSGRFYEIPAETMSLFERLKNTKED